MTYHQFMTELIEVRLRDSAIVEQISSAYLRILAQTGDGRLVVRKLDVPASDDEVRIAVAKLVHELGL